MACNRGCLRSRLCLELGASPGKVSLLLQKINKISIPFILLSQIHIQIQIQFSQVIYELKAGGVDERRLVGAKLEKLAEGESEPKGKPIEAMRGGR